MTKLVLLDPRGALIGQIHMSEAVERKLRDANKYDDMIMRYLKPEMEGPQCVMHLVAYKLRVMAHHLRAAYDGSKDHANHSCSKLFGVMSNVAGPPELDARRQRRETRIVGSRENPFVNFRGEPETEQSSTNDPDEQVVPIMKSYNPQKRIATMMLSDGTLYGNSKGT